MSARYEWAASGSRDSAYHPQNILLQSPQGLKYCVNCEEIENDKTYPSNCAVQQQFPKPQTVPSPQAESVSLDKLQTAVTSLHENSSVQQKFPKPLTVPSLQAESVLLAKLQTAVTSLHESSSVENSILQCQLIKAAADALLAVRRLSDTRSSSDTSVCENNS